MARTLWNLDEPNKLGMAREILKISPFHAHARAVLITKDWQNVKDQVARAGRRNPAFRRRCWLHSAGIIRRTSSISTLNGCFHDTSCSRPIAGLTGPRRQF